MSDEGGYTLLDHFRFVEEAAQERELSRADIAVLIALLRHCFDGVAECFPGIERLAEKARMSERHVKRSIKTLKDFGFLEVAKVGRSNTYRILFDRAEGASIEPQQGTTVVPNQMRPIGDKVRNEQGTGSVAIGDRNRSEQGTTVGPLNSSLNRSSNPERNPLGFASLVKSQQQDQKRSPEEQELETRETWRKAYRRAKDRGDGFMMQHLEQSEGWERIADLIDIAH